jgi:hypothetical protein
MKLFSYIRNKSLFHRVKEASTKHKVQMRCLMPERDAHWLSRFAIERHTGAAQAHILGLQAKGRVRWHLQLKGAARIGHRNLAHIGSRENANTRARPAVGSKHNARQVDKWLASLRLSRCGYYRRSACRRQ